MSRLIPALFLLVLCSFTGDKKGEKFFFVGDGKYVQTFELKFESPAGFSHISGVDNPDLARFYGEFEPGHVTPNFSKFNSRGIKKASLKIGPTKGSENLLDLISSGKKVHNDWALYLSKKKIHNLNLKYGTGIANVSLSDLSVYQLKIDNVNADVHVKCIASRPNKVVMDSLIIATHKGVVNLSLIHI